MFGLAGGDEEGAGALLTLAASGRDDPALYAEVLALAPPLLASPRRLSPHGLIVLLTCAGWAGAGGGSLFLWAV